MEDLGFTLNDFIEYLESINSYDIEMEEIHDERLENAINLSTIHKSKGLEYKIVYLIDPFSKNSNHLKGSYYTSSEGEFSLPSFTTSLTSNLLKIIENSGILPDKYLMERIRLLYVAMTRAEDCFIIVDKNNTLYEKNSINLKDAKTIGDFLLAANVEFEESEFGDKEYHEVDNNAKKIISNPFTYKKINCSMDKGDIKTSASKDMKFDAELETLKYGTHMHLLMEEVDFIKKDVSFIKDFTERKKVARVLENPLFKDIKNAKIFKEYQFFDVKNNKNGIIDLLLVYEEKCIVIDYKLSNIEDSAYKDQLQIYKGYVEEIFKKPCKCFLISIKDDSTKEVF